MQDFPPWLGPAREIRATWRLGMRTVAVSGWLAGQVEAAGGKATVVPPGIDHAPFGVRTPPEDREPVVAMLYSRAPYKAPEDGVAAIRLARDARPDLRAVVFGSGPRPATLPGWMEYRRAVPQDGLVELYNEASVFLCSSLAEGFALPPAEAMACGCAVVTTDCGGNREYATHGETALVSRPGDPHALGSNLTRLLEDERFRLALAERGREAVDRFTWDAAGTALAALL